MTLLNDKRALIKPINIKLENIDNILENLIIHDNIIYNSYIFNKSFPINHFLKGHIYKRRGDNR